MAKWIVGMAMSAAVFGQTVEQPARAVTDPGVVTTRQTITPAGVASIFQGRVSSMVFGADSREIWVLHQTHLYRMDWVENRVLTRHALGGNPGLQGIAKDGDKVYAAVSVKRKIGLIEAGAGGVRNIAEDLGTYNPGAIAAGAGKALIPVTTDNLLAVVDLVSGQPPGKIPTGKAPFAAVMNREGTVAWVSNWGGRVPEAKDLTAPTGDRPDSDRVVVNAHGIAASGTVSRIDLIAGKVTHSLATELHPTALAWDEKAGRLYVANSNSDSITVINAAANSVARHIPLQPFAKKTPGVAPTALALADEGKTLYVACGGINAVAVMDTASGKVRGLIPTAWYPNGLALSGDGKHLAVSALLGIGSGWRDEPSKRYVHANRGSVHVLPVPDEAQLASYTTAVAENNHLPLTPEPAPPVLSKTPRAIPMRSGEPSKIEHVVFIIKENRTYDQLFGDLGRGNGDPSLVLFGESVTPNQRRLATQFVLLDNFYATGGNSADGHQWITQANEVSYCLWPGYQGRSYPFDGTDPLAISSSGFLWDLALARGKTARVYGEYAGSLPEPRQKRFEYFERWAKGEDFTKEWNITAPIASLNRILAKNYPPYSNTIPDVIRAQIFLRDLEEWNKNGGMPNLTVMLLPTDHTFGTAAGASTPKAMVADNDYALGMIVEKLTHSKFWPKMAIFVVEDDAQNGVDHVDGHRTVALAISPYVRRGHIDSTFYAQQSMLKTIELILGLPTLSLFDMIATDMRASFQETPDLSPYTAVKPQQDLLEKNPELKALRGKAREAARRSAAFNWDVPDAAPSRELNRILWHSIKGWATPYPGVKQAVFAPMEVEGEEEEEHDPADASKRSRSLR